MRQSTYRLIVLLGVIGVSFSAIFVRYATAPPLVLALYRMMIAAACLLPIVCGRYRRARTRPRGRDIGLCMLSGLFLGAHFTLYFSAVRMTSIASATVLVDTEVFFVAAVSVLFLRERLTRGLIIGIVLTFVGSILLAWSDRAGGTDILTGDLCALGGALCVAVYTLIGRAMRKRMDTTLYTFVVYATSACGLALFCLCSGTRMLGYGAPNYVWGALLAIVCTLLGHSVFSWSLKYVPATFVAIAKLGEPVAATVLGIFLFKQTPAPMQILGGLVIIIGLCYSSSSSSSSSSSVGTTTGSSG